MSADTSGRDRDPLPTVRCQQEHVQKLSGILSYRVRESNQPEAYADDHGQTIIGLAEPLLLIVDSYRMDWLAVSVRSLGRQRHDFAVGGKRSRCSEE